MERGVSVGEMMSAVCVCMCVRTCNKQCVHAWWRLGGLEHFGDVLLRQRRLPSALSLGVLLLPPLEVLERGTQRKRGGIREGGSWGGGRGKERKKPERNNSGSMRM